MRSPDAKEMEVAKLFSLLHTGSPGDAAFYRKACRNARSVLELGCGFGRLLPPLAEAGLQVTGVDRDPAMLALAERSRGQLSPELSSRIELLQGDMTVFRNARLYDRVLIPFNGLYCLASDDEVRACLETARAHLRDGGRLLLDAYRVDPEDEPGPEEDADAGAEYLTTLLDGDREIEVREIDAWDPASSTVEVTYLYTFRQGGTPRQVRQTIRHRYLAPDRLRSLLQEAGFRILSEYGGFQGEKPGPGAAMMVLEAG